MNSEVYLFNILKSIELIEGYTHKVTFDNFKSSRITQDAVSKRVEEIGENIRKIPSETKKKYSKVEWSAFIETRNFLTHVYQLVNLQKLWNIIKFDLPILKSQVKEIMKKEKRKSKTY